jgi:hypothetical protein|tara:strand:- start:9265 stop:9522 length:258 start_codon:yes stop_codon:yes gene_type:complete
MRNNKGQFVKGFHSSTKTEFKLGDKIRLGAKHSEGAKKSISNKLLGRKLSEETKKKVGESHKGNKHWNWKGGISSNKEYRNRQKR